MLLLCQHIALCTDTLQICMHKMHTVITGHIKYAQKVWHFPFNAVFQTKILVLTVHTCTTYQPKSRFYEDVASMSLKG